MKYEALLSPKEAAKQLRCTVGTLANWRTNETGPCFTKMPNGRVYYTQQSIDQYLQQNLQSDRIKNTRLVPLSSMVSAHSKAGINTV